ncbi:hypothetical protein MVEN_01876800 [Mycena venus]|uniref:DUF6534 domain-containing protein n=1 Tax=Mycena venus TaxID=2733690 RepID=A0A8H6XH44_9AGAR|nr:hypothetical protein MVEN_01876800 [Mycena venus]
MDAITGALLIGTWVSSLLYTAELHQAMYYYRHFKNDNSRLNTLVWVAFFIDTVSLLDDYVSVYLNTITHAGDPAYLLNQNLSSPVCVLTTAAVAIIVQTFMITRYWKFSHKHVIALFLCLLIFAGFGLSFTCAIIVVLFPAYKDRFKLKIPVILWLVTEAVADLGIAAALLWEFLRTKSSSTETQNVLNGLVTVTLQTGTATAAVALVAVIGYLLSQESNIGVLFTLCLGRTYMLSMLANLNIRKSARVWNPSTSRAATSTTLSTSVAFAQPGTGMDTNLSGLYAHRTTTVHIGGQQDRHPGLITIKSSMHGPEHTTDIEMGPLPWRKEEEELNFNTRFKY